MKLISFFFLTALIMSSSGGYAINKPEPQDQSGRSQIKVYTDFLAGVKINPVDYVMGLYDTYDVIVFCERDHRELTQYDFLLSLFKDERFINTVGNVFTEVGGANMTGEINHFLTQENLTPVQVKDSILKIYRYLDFYPLWEKYNYYYLLEGLYNINNALPAEKKICLYPSDAPFSWDTCTTKEGYTGFTRNLWPARDSIMAYNIIPRIRKIQEYETRKKVFVILNSPHAYLVTSKHEKAPTGHYIFQKFPDKTVNIIIHTPYYDNEKEKYTCTQNGKWDAAFSKMDNPSVGFDLKGTPFGMDAFDLRKHYDQFSFEEMFTGFIFYKPIEKHKIVLGIPGVIDGNFMEELIRRETITGAKPGRLKKGELNYYYNKLRKYKYENIKEMQKQIKQYLKN